MGTQATVSGVVKYDGTVYSGTGFTTSVLDSKGRMQINFNTPFSALPAASVTSIFTGSDNYIPSPPEEEGQYGSSLDNAVICGLTTSNIQVITGKQDGSLAQRYFTFIVMGQA